ncbi:acyl-protein synthetase [Hypoxylon sp. FL1284]|nr:acyl-protein synthetase [Hypoxylon sp. FL1284]
MTLSSLLSFWPVKPRLWSTCWLFSLFGARSGTKPYLQEPEPEHCCLQDILKARAASGKGAIIYYPLGDTSTSQEVSYLELFDHARRYSRIIHALPGFVDKQPVLLHLDTHWDTIVWFWAVLLANGLPVLSPSFSNVDEHRHQHIHGLSNLLQYPICITRSRLLALFDGSRSLLQLHTIESLCHDEHEPVPALGAVLGNEVGSLNYKGDRALAMLMLTSGSTGNAKAVRLTHRQVLAAISGKASVRSLHSDGPFLNWIGLDHVASLVEIHIQALWLGVDQVHVNAADVVSSPHVFLDLLSRHRVCRTFAPNFFLGRLVSTAQADSVPKHGRCSWDLSNLQVVASGGEANDVKTCAAAASLFHKFGACSNVVTPGFGMTETCAGAIFNLSCPDYDVERGHAVACLGKCMKGIEMRVVVGSRLAADEEPGDLEVRGDVVFDGYYRNSKATEDAFPSHDGWFRTGDQATINADGSLCLIGRKKEVININGIKINTADIDSLLEQVLGDRVSRFVVFPSRAAHTEQVTISYVPKRWPHIAKDMAEIEELATQACMVSVSAHPLIFSLKGSSLPLLPTSTLGKISRAKMSSLFDAGVFNEDVSSHRQSLKAYRGGIQSASSLVVSNVAESLLVDDFAKTLGINPDMIRPDTQVFELGFNSMDLIRLKRRIDARLGIAVPVITLIKNPTARLLAAALSSKPSSSHLQERADVLDYDPVVIFKSSGTKTPLWLIHPGVGEVLVFVGLTQHLAEDDRPIYALRARGFEPGQSRFSCITETVDFYVQAIQRHQPYGPYALAGYSYGAMLAFETAKRLDAITVRAAGTGSSSAVRFLGSFNLPPHIRSRMRQLNWNMCLLHLAQFLGLMTEDAVEAMEQERSGFGMTTRDGALERVVGAADGGRMEELGLEEGALARWANVAYGLQSMAVDYEPSGQVDGIDVFHAIPLKWAAPSREEWVSGHLSKWRDFSRTEPRVHAVGGTHYTLIGPEHVAGFTVKLKAALAARGI